MAQTTALKRRIISVKKDGNTEYGIWNMGKHVDEDAAKTHFSYFIFHISIVRGVR